MIKANIYGKDMHKIEKMIIPEGLGIVPSLVYLLLNFIGVVFMK